MRCHGRNLMAPDEFRNLGLEFEEGGKDMGGDGRTKRGGR
jgi:hypothetical protein